MGRPLCASMSQGHPLTEEQKQEIQQRLTEYWGGHKEELNLDVFDGSVRLALRHTEEDVLKVQVIVMEPERFELDEWPDRMKDVSEEFLTLSASVDSTLGNAFGYNGRLPMHKSPQAVEVHPMYEANLEMRDLEVDMEVPQYVENIKTW